MRERRPVDVVHTSALDITEVTGCGNSYEGQPLHQKANHGLHRLGDKRSLTGPCTGNHAEAQVEAANQGSGSRARTVSSVLQATPLVPQTREAPSRAWELEHNLLSPFQSHSPTQRRQFLPEPYTVIPALYERKLGGGSRHQTDPPSFNAEEVVAFPSLALPHCPQPHWIQSQWGVK